MKTKDQLHQRESVILRPRVVLKDNSQSGSQDLPLQEERSSWESQQNAESCGETRSNTADYRVPGISTSTVKLQDAQRQNNVTKLIEMFEKHQHEEQFLKDMSQMQEINRFSEESQKLLDDMNQTERDLRNLREFCKTSTSWLQCLLRNRDHLLQLREKFEVFAESYNRRPIATSFRSLALSFWRIPVEDQNMVLLNDRWCFSGRNRCLRKQDKANMGAIQRYSQGGTTKKSTESWRSTILAKRKSCFSIASRLQDTTFQLRELNGYRTPNIGFFVWMLMGLKSLFDSDKNFPLH